MTDWTPQQLEEQGRQYVFHRTPFYPRDYEGFNTVRWKMDAWMRGWIAQQKIDKPTRKPTGRQRGAKDTP